MNDAGSLRRTRLDKLNTRRKVQTVLLSLVGLAVAIVFALIGPTPEYNVTNNGNKFDFVGSETGWQDSFGVGNLYSNSLELFIRPYVLSTNVKNELKKDITIFIDVTGINPEGKTTKLVDGVKIVRPIHCYGPSEKLDVECRDVSLFKVDHIVFSRYNFTVQVLDEDEKEAEFVEYAYFFWRYEWLKYAIWEIRINYLCFGASVLLSMYWFMTCRVDAMRHGGDADHGDQLSMRRMGWFQLCCCCCPRALCPYSTNIQRWVLALLVGLMCYNQPLYGLEYVNASGWRVFFVIFSSTLQIFFATVVMMFWMSAFESLYLTGAQNKIVVLLRYLFFVTFFVCASFLYGRILYTQAFDPTYFWTYDALMERQLQQFLSLYGIVYFVWLLFIILRALGHLASMTSSYRFVYFSHMWRIVVFVAGIGVGAFFAVDPRHSQVTTFFQLLINFYILEIVYLYEPIRSKSTTMDESDEANDLGAVGVNESTGGGQQIEFSNVVPSSRDASGRGRDNQNAVNKDTDTTQINLALV